MGKFLMLITEKQYPISVWIITILLTPIFMVTFIGLAVIPVFWIFGGIYSFPSLLIFILSNRLIDRFRIPNFAKKIIFSLIGVSCIIITFNILGGSFAPNLTIFYSIVFFILSLSIKRELV